MCQAIYSLDPNGVGGACSAIPSSLRRELGPHLLPFGASMGSSIDSNVLAIHHGRRFQIEGSVILPTQITASIPLGRAKITETFRGSQKQSSGKKALIRIRLI